MIVHRGGSWPETAEAGADDVEIDVRPSLEGEVFAMHDARLERTMELSGRIPETLSARMAAAGVPRDVPDRGFGGRN